MKLKITVLLFLIFFWLVAYLLNNQSVLNSIGQFLNQSNLSHDQVIGVFLAFFIFLSILFVIVAIILFKILYNAFNIKR